MTARRHLFRPLAVLLLCCSVVGAAGANAQTVTRVHELELDEGVFACIAFHAPKADASGYEIQIVDVQRRTVRRLGGLSGSSVFPSWTSDGRLSFRYDADDYHGFVVVTGALEAPELPLANGTRVAAEPSWDDLFPRSPAPAGAAMVLVWSTWSAHSEDALKALQRFSNEPALARAGAPIAVRSTLDISSNSEDAGRMRSQWQIRVPEIERTSSPVFALRTATQMPMYLLFEDGRLVGDRLGAQSAAELATWWKASAPMKK